MKGIERFHWTTFEWLYMAPENPYDDHTIMKLIVYMKSLETIMMSRK